MTTFIAVFAGIATFLVTQFIGALALALAGTYVQPLRPFISLDPWKSLLRLLMWGTCAWFGLEVYGTLI